MRTHRSVAALVGAFLAGLFALNACADPPEAPAAAGVSVPSPTPTASPTADYSSCAKVVYATQKTATVKLPVGACLSFRRFSDIAAVITNLTPTDPRLFRRLDPLSYRATTSGRTTITIGSKQEVCTATAACQVPNIDKHLTVVVTG